MKKIFLRLISFSDDVECFDSVKAAFLCVLEKSTVQNVDFCGFQTYWKLDGYGEINISFEVKDGLEIDNIKEMLSSRWKYDVTDSRWANIFCSDVHFIWWSEE